MAAHFLSRCNSWARDERMWSICRQEREVQSHTDYLLLMDRHLFWNVYVYDPCHTLEHFVVLGCLHCAARWEHFRYLGQRCWFPLRLQKNQTQGGLVVCDAAAGNTQNVPKVTPSIPVDICRYMEYF